MPTETGLAQFAPEKKPAAIRGTMAGLRLRIEEAKAEKKAPRFSPAGQSTQMIVGADGANDAAVLQSSARLYSSYGLKRVYYSAFSPIPDGSAILPVKSPPLQREHRLYQADWLLRFYGFSVDEIVGATQGGMLDLAIDPKMAWALQNRERFPLDVNTADREMLLRVPGLGKKAVDRLVVARRHRTLRLDDVARLAGSVRRARPFIITPDHRPLADPESAILRAAAAPARQLSLFG
jgi:predicted DNA-binding helix-hairpin-helix protein